MYIVCTRETRDKNCSRVCGQLTLDSCQCPFCFGGMPVCMTSSSYFGPFEKRAGAGAKKLAKKFKKALMNGLRKKLEIM